MAEAIPPNTVEFYKVLFEQARDGIFIADGEGRYIDVNESGHRMLGHEPRSLVGKQITDILRPEDHSRLAAEMSLLKAGESLTREWRLVRKDGTLLDAEITAQQLSNKQLLGVVRDISDKKAAEEGILNLAKGTASRGQEFFQLMVEYLAKGLRADYAFAGQLLGQNHDRVRTVALWAEGALAGNIEYELKNTPCANVIGKQVCFYPRDVQALFAQDELLIQMGIHAYIGAPVFDGVGQALGIVVVLWKKPCAEYSAVEPMLQIFAARAGAEWERERAESELSNSLQRLSLATQSGNIGIWDWNVVSNELQWDDRMYSLYGIQRQDFSGAVDAWEKGLHPDDLLRARNEITAALSGSNEFHSEFRVIWPDGRTRHIEGHGIVLRGTDGIAKRMIGTNWDITARKTLENDLQQSEQRWRSIAENPFDFVVVIDRNYRYTYVNHAAPGINLESLIGQATPFDFADPLNHAVMRDAFQTTFETGKATSYEVYVPQLDAWYSSLVGPIHENGNVTSLSILTREITKEKRAEKLQLEFQTQLQQTQKMESLGRLAGGVAHDMNNVLMAILGMSSVQLELQPQGSATYRAFDVISKAATRGGELTQGLLNFARQSPAVERDLDMNLIIREQVRLLEHTTLSTVDLEMALAPDLRPIRGDASALAHAIMNLCVNAVDAMSGKGKLTIQTRTDGNDRIEVLVKDTGCGMTQTVQAKALEPFFTTKEQGKGTGLGLSIVHSTVKAHQGQITIESELGKGTIIRLSFPSCAPANERVELDGVNPSKPITPELHILVVDDDEMVLNILQPMLQMLGHKFTLVQRGEEALLKLNAGLRPDLVFLDVNMPGWGGIETLSRIRSLFATLPVILSTGRADQMVFKLLDTHNHVTLLSKPFNLNGLRDQIELHRLR